MGLGVVDVLGGSPRKKWELRIGMIDSDRLKAVALALLEGQKVESRDDDVQVTWSGRGTSTGALRVRDADTTTRFLIDISLYSLGQEEIDGLHAADSAGVATRVPDAWMSDHSETVVAWELFNCRVVSVVIARA